MKTYRLGDLIEPFYQACGIPNLKLEDVSGINRDKEFFEPAKQVGADTSNYQIVPQGYFACNLMHVGRDVVLPISCNHSERVKIVSPAYTVFYIKDETIILKEYFFMMLKSDEKDRFFWFHTDSSVRDGMSWEDFTSLEMKIPSIDIQKKYVAVYKAMQRNLAVYQSKVDDLKLVCDGYIEKLRSNYPCKRIGNYIEYYDEKNSDSKITLEQGINIKKEFITPQRENSNLTSRKIVRTGQFAYCTQLNNENVAIAYREGCDCVVSPVYDIFEITKKDELNPYYLLLWLLRGEFGRFVYWASTGTSYEFLNPNDLTNYEIPIPEMEIQKSIACIYNTYIKRKTIAEKMKSQINSICPVLIKGALKEGE